MNLRCLQVLGLALLHGSLGLLLAGCPKDKDEIAISLASGTELPSPRFVIYDAKSPEHPRCSNINVRDSANWSDFVWHINSTAPGSQLPNQITYGVVPPGYAQPRDSVPLAPAHDYEFSCSHDDAKGSLHFRVTEQGSVETLGGQ